MTKSTRRGASAEEGSAESHIDDPIRMYLMQMGEIPMLSRDDEMSSARQIEETRGRFRHLLLGNDFVLHGAVELLEKVPEGELRLDRTIEIWSPTRRRRNARSSGCAPNLAHDQAPAAAESGRFPRGDRQEAADEPRSTPPGDGWWCGGTKSCGWWKS